jgi:hypothetical protein
MKCLFIPAALCAIFLSGCAHPETSEDAFMNRMVQPVAYSLPPTVDASFCRNVAAHDAGLIMYDKSTHDRVFAASYGRCLTDYALSDTGLRVADLRIGANNY